MYCQSCGIALAQQVKFCNRCGTQLIAANDPELVKTLEKRLDEYLEGLFWITIIGLGVIAYSREYDRGLIPIPNIFEESTMNKLRLFLRISLVVGLTLAFTSLVQAQATRTWVSGVGDDANPCSRTAPCKTFAGAISKTAAGGEIDALDSGGFGAVTITKSITIDGTGMNGGILASGTTGIVINITGETDVAKSVRIRGLSINGASLNSSGNGLNGIRVSAANNVTIENVVIDGFKNSGISIQAAAPAKVFVRNCTIRNNESGISIAGDKSQVAISGVSFIYNGTALVPGTGSIISFKNNVFFGNTKDGDVTPGALK